MKKFTSIIIMAALLAGLAGCDKPANPSDSSTTNESTTTTVESTQSGEPTIEPVPEGEPTNLVGLDGKRIYTSEINTNLTDPEIIERLSDYTFYQEPIKPNAVMDSFLFFKPSTGISYNIHDNPELYAENENGFMHFVGEVPENTNEWQKVNVGDEICGLTLKTAEMGLVMDEDGDFIPTGWYYSEFDGEITLTGYLYVSSPAELYNLPGGGMELYFFDGSVPLPAGSAVTNYSFDKISFSDGTIFNHGDFMGISEVPTLSFDETIDETSVDMTGITLGDVVKVKATVSNFRCSVKNITGQQTFSYYTGHLADIEILSDVIENG